MRRTLASLLIATTIAVASPVHAGAADWFRNRPASPYRLNFMLDGPLLLIALPAWLGSYYAENSLSPPTCGQPGNLCDVNQVPWFDRHMMYTNTSLKTPADYMFTWGPLITAGVLFVDYGPYHVGSYLTDLTIALEGMAWSGTLTHIFRFAVRRPRPYLYFDGVYPGSRNSADATMSFWSGHVSEWLGFGVALAWTFTLRHGVRSPWTWVMWSAMLGAGTVSAVFRVASGDHFFSDVVAGAAVGTGIGLIIPNLHSKRQTIAAKVLGAIRPMSGPGYGGLSLVGAL